MCFARYFHAAKVDAAILSLYRLAANPNRRRASLLRAARFFHAASTLLAR